MKPFTEAPIHLTRACLRLIQFLAARVANRNHHPSSLVATSAAADLYKAYLVARDVPQGGRVIDVGCGSAHLLRQMLLFNSFEAFGVDLAPPPCREVQVSAFDGHRLPFDGRSFDVALLGYVLHHLSPDHARELVDEAIRVTRSGGRLILFEDSLSEFDGAYALRNWAHFAEAGLEYRGQSSTYRHPEGHHMFLTRAQWQHLLEGRPRVRSVRVEGLDDFYKNRHHTMIVVSV
jgi:SAM-dependent methyltransferase